MNKSINKSHLALVLMLGSVWGISEVALGMGLKTCASLVSGSLMTGVALFFIATIWVATRNIILPALIVLVAAFFKLFDAVLLSLPVFHGAIGNPIFAFLMEGLAFIVLIIIFRHKTWGKTSSRVLLGAGSALAAVALFPLVKFATGVPACVYPGTAVPLSILFAPVAIVFSAFTVPLGFIAGERIGAYFEQVTLRIKSNLLRYMVSPLALAICLTLVFLFRLVVVSDF